MPQQSTYRSFSKARPYRAGPRTQQRRTPRPQGRGQYIDESRFVQAAKIVEAEVYIPTHQFQDFAVHDLIKQNLASKGYVTPTPIQDQTIIAALEGKDVIGVASTGTGKTAAFAVPLLHALINDKRSRALIVAPTRELALQIQDECRSIATGSGLYGALLIGGVPIGPQLRELSSFPRIVVGTPGRIMDHLERGSLKLSSFNFAVLDEVDRMLDMGFVKPVRTILDQLSSQRQSFFFSATMDAGVSSLIHTFANDPVTISLKGSQASENVNQDVVRFVGPSDKMDKLHNILMQPDVSKAIVFDATKHRVERLSKELVTRGFMADAIHGGKSQGQRQRALTRFKKNEVTILVATDVAARGIDVADISHVINFSVPQSYDDYVHRIGRAGRAGKTGQALTFVG